MSPRALFVTTVPVTLEVFLAPFARHFREQGWRVDALARDASGTATLRDSFDAVYDAHWTRSPRSLLHLPQIAREVRELVARNRYDLVHVHTPIAAFATRFALRSARPRPVVIYTAHGFHFYAGGRTITNAIYHAMERAAARWTHYLVTINAEDFAAARAFGTIARERVRLIPGIGVDPTPFAEGAVPDSAVQALRSELDVPHDAFVLLMIAEFGAVKRHAHLLDALAQVRDERVVTVLVGDGPLEGAIRERAAALGLSKRVRFAGYRRDIPALLAAADALVLVSEREGLARSVLEAMAAGRPVIGTRTRGITDLVEPDAGWIVPKHDTAALARAIGEAAASPAECETRGAAGRHHVIDTYALPRIIAAYEELYREALASRV